jgi:hypothetical protein
MKRGRGQRVAGVLAKALARTHGARLPAAAAAFAEACGFPLARECAARALTRDGRLLVEARSERWAEQLVALAPAIAARVNERLGADAVSAIEVRVRPAAG